MDILQGRQFDKNGNLVDWWDPRTKERYLEKAKCIIEQYGNYTAEEVNLKVSLLIASYSQIIFPHLMNFCSGS